MLRTEGIGYRPSTKAIVIEAANRQVKTLVHELSHALVRADRHDDVARSDTRRRR